MRNTVLLVFVLTALSGVRALADSSLFAAYDIQVYPDIVSSDLNLNYAPGAGGAAGRLTLSGSAVQFAISPSTAHEIRDAVVPAVSYYGSFNLDATIAQTPDLSGESVTGTVEIRGKVAGLYEATGTLLTGDLFGFRSEFSTQMEFLFDVTGGDAAAAFGRIGYVAVSDFGSGDYNQDFKVAFSNNSVQSDTNPAVMPEPGSFFLAAFGLVGLVAGNRVRRKRQQQVS